MNQNFAEHQRAFWIKVEENANNAKDQVFKTYVVAHEQSCMTAGDSSAGRQVVEVK